MKRLEYLRTRPWLMPGFKTLLFLPGFYILVIDKILYPAPGQASWFKLWYSRLMPCICGFSPV